MNFFKWVESVGTRVRDTFVPTPPPPDVSNQIEQRPPLLDSVKLPSLSQFEWMPGGAEKILCPLSQYSWPPEAKEKHLLLQHSSECPPPDPRRPPACTSTQFLSVIVSTILLYRPQYVPVVLAFMFERRMNCRPFLFLLLCAFDAF